MRKRASTLERKQQVYETLKERILSNQLKPGEVLVASELGAQFGISRTPIHGIITQLSHERLVKQIPYVGTCVTEITREDIQEIYEIRGALESVAVHNAVIRVPEHELDGLERVFDRARREIIEGGDIWSAQNQTRMIHDLIIAYSGNRRLQAYVRSLRNESTRIISIVTSSPAYDPKPEPGFEEKYEIFLALRDRDAEKASELIARHYKNSIIRLAPFFSRRSSVHVPLDLNWDSCTG